MKQLVVIIGIFLLLLPIMAFAQYQQQSTSGGMIDWTDQVIREVGIGSPNPNQPISAQRAGALEAAKRVALRNLLERVQGMNINSEVTVEDYMVTHDVIRNQIEGTVRNFKVVDTRYKSDGSVEVEVEVPLSGIYKAVLPSEIPSGMPMLPSPEGQYNPASVYTGLIIDARGLGLRPAIAPKLMDQNNMEVYGTGRVSRDYAMEIGVVGYEKSVERARANERVTNNPLVVKAVAVSGTHETDPVVSNRDAEQIRGAAQNLNFLQQCKVMFILD
ncbi:MAG: hypothetical protein WAN36_05400 [Calditrichia bacterium]